MKDDRLISLNAAIDAMMKLQAEDIEAYGASIPEGFDGDRAVAALKALPSATDTNVGGNLSVDELITFLNPESNYVFYDDSHGFCINTQDVIDHLCVMPSAQPDHIGEVTEMVGDVISRQAAIDAVDESLTRVFVEHRDIAEKMINKIPSAQPERTCVNCGRTINNGGWYADGGTRCPIEEHYALPKDGYCHLWEKRNVTDDNYPERREE